MSIDWIHFTPLSSACGGLLIGAAASVLLLFNGRIAGISGVIGGLLRPINGDIGWRVAFILGLTMSPKLLTFLASTPDYHVEAGAPLLIFGGLLVGLGTRYGSGCTSGHGVCGVSRLSPRSLTATAVFMASGFLSVFVLRHLMR